MAVMVTASAIAGPAAGETSDTSQLSDGLAINRFEPAAPGDPFFGVPSPMIQGRLVPRVSITFDYAREPLVLHSGDGKDVLVSSQAFAHFAASLALVDHLLVDIALPVAIVQMESDPADRRALNSFSFSLPPGPSRFIPELRPAFGDLRAGARIRVLGEDSAPLQLAVGLRAHLPTGRHGKFQDGEVVGEGALRVSPHIIAGGRTSSLIWSSTLGVLVRSSNARTNRPTSLLFSAAASLVLGDDRLFLGPEIATTTPLYSGHLNGPDGYFNALSTGSGAEVHLGLRLRLGAFFLGVAAGPGFGDGWGTPSYRMLGLIALSPRAEDRRPRRTARPDRAGADHEVGPACSTDPTRSGEECPPDADDDAIADSLDLCPDAAGAEEHHGCPEARAEAPASGESDAASGTGDLSDPAAPDEDIYAEVSLDADEDGILDADDACPEERGEAAAKPEDHGCPTLVRIRGDEIVLLDNIAFSSRQNATVDVAPTSVRALTQVRDIIAQHREFVMIEIQGHTDSTGSEPYNQQISTRRAEIVRDWLIAQGVQPASLVARGYGSSRPIASNLTIEGRRKNRRMSIVIIETTR